jgi:hypothetical protein
MLQDTREQLQASLSIATIGIVGTFMATAILGVKREVQVLLLIPVSVAAAYYIALRPGRLLDPLIAFATVKLAVEVLLRGQLIFALDSIAAVLALIVIAAAPARSVLTGARTVVALAGLLAAMGLLQTRRVAPKPPCSTSWRRWGS